MDRYIKIGIYIAVLFFVSIWISSVVKSCGNTDLTETTTDVGESDSPLDEFEEDFFEDNLGDGETSYDSDMGGGTVPNETEDYGDTAFDTDYTAIDEALEEKSSTTNHTTYSKPAAKTSSTGRYLVLAGSYLIKDNARSMVGKLDKIGYDNAEIVVFNMSQYHSVCAARLSDYNEAVKLSNELRRRGIDSYVHTKH